MSSSQARGRSPPPVHKSVVVQYLKEGHLSSSRPPLYSPYPSTGHSSVGRVVRPYEPPALLTCLRLTRAFSLITSRACNEVHVEDGTHRVDIRPTSGSLTLHTRRPWCYPLLLEGPRFNGELLPMDSLETPPVILEE